MSDTFSWLMEPFIGSWPAAARDFVHRLAFVAALVEVATGVGLLTKRFRTVAIFTGIAMHAFILITDWTAWTSFQRGGMALNLAMITFLLILFFRRTDDPAPRDILWGQTFTFQKIVLILFALLPALSFFNLWDHYLSSSLYSGNRNSGAIYVSDDVFDRLPEQIQDYVTEGEPNRNRLSINNWSLGELNVPSYPEIRIYKNVAKQICSYAPDGPGVELAVDGKLTLIRRRGPIHLPLLGLGTLAYFLRQPFCRLVS